MQNGGLYGPRERASRPSPDTRGLDVGFWLDTLFYTTRSEGAVVSFWMIRNMMDSEFLRPAGITTKENSKNFNKFVMLSPWVPIRLVFFFSPNFFRVELDQQLPLDRPCEHRLRLAWLAWASN